MGAYEYQLGFETNAPIILESSIKMNGEYLSGMGNIPVKPVIEFDIIDKYGETTLPKVEIWIDDKLYTVTPVKVAGETDKYHIIYTSEVELEEGNHRVAIRVTNLYGQTDYFENTSLSVLGPGEVVESPRNAPNPFSPRRGEITTIEYSLSKNTDVKVIIYNITGKAIWIRQFASGSNGGWGVPKKNSVPWNGRTEAGEIAPNGVYIYFITSQGKVLGKGQATLLD